MHSPHTLETAGMSGNIGAIKGLFIAEQGIDWSDWETFPDSQFIKPPALIADDVKNMFAHGIAAEGTQLPWPKTHDKFRLRMGELTLWAGQNSSGKSMVVSQVMAWVACHEAVLIISPELQPKSLIYRKVRQVAGNANPTPEFIDYALEWMTGRIWFLDISGEIDPSRIQAIVNYAVSELGVKHVVIDSLMMTTVRNDDFAGQSAFVNRLIAHGKALNIHTHLVAHSRKPEAGAEHRKANRYSIKGSGDISDKADNVVMVWRNEKKEELMQWPETAAEVDDETTPDVVIRVDKQRNFDWVGNIGMWWHSPSWSYCENHRRRTVEWPAVRGWMERRAA